MPSTVQTDTDPAVTPQSCPSWCVTNHFRFDDRIGEVQACHFSDDAVFGSEGTGRRLRVDLGCNPDGTSFEVCVVDADTRAGLYTTGVRPRSTDAASRC